MVYLRALLLAVVLCPFIGHGDTFWNKDRSRSFEGEFVKKDGDKFVFKRESDGKTFKLSAAQLAKEHLDQLDRPANILETRRLFDFRDGAVFLKVLPEKPDPQEIKKALNGWDVLERNTRFIGDYTENQVGPTKGSFAHDLRWLNRDWTLVVELPGNVPAFNFFLRGSADLKREEAEAVQKEIEFVLSALTGAKPAERWSIWEMSPATRGQEDGGMAQGFLLGLDDKSMPQLGYLRYVFMPKHLIILTIMPYRR